jgi:hypothetical protein
VLDKSLYLGKVLYFFKEYSCNFVLASTGSLMFKFKELFHNFNINFSADDKP